MASIEEHFDKDAFTDTQKVQYDSLTREFSNLVSKVWQQLQMPQRLNTIKMRLILSEKPLNFSRMTQTNILEMSVIFMNS